MREIGSLGLDTNAIIAYRQGNTAVFNLIEDADLILIPVTVLGELIYGALNSTRKEMNLQAIEHFARNVDLLPIDESVARRYAIVRSNLKKLGRPIPENDIWIAASCLERDIPLVTRDSHFISIEGLEVISWDT